MCVYSHLNIQDTYLPFCFFFTYSLCLIYFFTSRGTLNILSYTVLHTHILMQTHTRREHIIIIYKCSYRQTRIIHTISTNTCKHTYTYTHIYTYTITWTWLYIVTCTQKHTCAPHTQMHTHKQPSGFELNSCPIAPGNWKLRLVTN